MLTVSIFEVLSIAKVTFMFKVIFIFGVVFIFVQLHSEIANPTQLQLVGLGADFVFPCHKTTHPQQPMQHILSNMDKEMILHLGNFVAALECLEGIIGCPNSVFGCEGVSEGQVRTGQVKSELVKSSQDRSSQFGTVQIKVGQIKSS